jgi:hypothetical protein
MTRIKKTKVALSDEELYARVTELWPRVREMLRAGIEAVENEMEESIDSEDAFKLTNLLILREVFWRKTIAIAIERDDTKDIPVWIEQLYDDWEHEAEEDEENGHHD